MNEQEQIAAVNKLAALFDLKINGRPWPKDTGLQEDLRHATVSIMRNLHEEGRLTENEVLTIVERMGEISEDEIQTCKNAVQAMYEVLEEERIP